MLRVSPRTLPVMVLLLLAGNTGRCDELAKGEAVYRMHCVRCHGMDGQGTKDKFNEPLSGDLSITELATVIDETMPEGDPDACSTEDSAAVAAYIHQAFYSEVARERLRPARIELARLTIPQYRNAVTDLFITAPTAAISSEVRSQAPGNWFGRLAGEREGLRGEYFDARNFKRDKRIIDRVDPVVDFDFGVGKPDEENFMEDKIAARWEGAVLTAQTGQYDFIVETENATRLWVNGQRTPIIDAWVRSGEDRTFRGSLFLLGGRAYPIRLEFLKFGEKTASIRLKWKPPRDREQVIPARHLRVGGAPELMIVDTQFPPDDSSAGYARGNAISKEWDQATTEAALTIADNVVQQLDSLVGIKPESEDRANKVKEFCYRMLERAWSRPLNDEEKRHWVDQHFNESELGASVKKIVLITLKSPSFLFREIGQARSRDLAVATRLSFGLWDSLPDTNLSQIARSGQLHEESAIVLQAERMLEDPRTRSKIHEFFANWLRLDSEQEIGKDRVAWPEFSDSVGSDLRTSLDIFLAEVIWSERSDFRELLRADYLWLNRPLAEIYAPEYVRSMGDRLPDGFAKVPCGADRSGILTHPFLMATFAYHNSTSPIHRGIFLARGILGRTIKAPPEAVTPVAPELHAGLSTRERVQLQTSPASCQTCHGMINPLGYSLENFDAIGRFRLEEKGKPINASGTYRDRLGKLSTFNGSRELATYLVDSREVQTAFVQQLFYHLVKQPPAAFGPDTLPDLRDRFVKNEFNIKKLIVDIMRVSTLRGIELQTQTEGQL